MAHKKNHALSSNISAALATQGVNLLLRTALARAPLALAITHTHDDPTTGVETLTTRQTGFLGHSASTEDRRTLDGAEVATSHVVFGHVASRARFVPAAVAIKDDDENDDDATTTRCPPPLPLALRQGGPWEEDGTRELVELRSRGPGWTGWQAWGFEVIGGRRYHVRRAILQKGTQATEDQVAPDHVLVKMVYDWVGP